MKNILLVGMTSGVGGVETFIENVVNNINTSQFHVEILAFQPLNSNAYDKLIHVHVNYVHSFKLNPLKCLIDVARLFSFKHFDIVHLNECSAKMFVYCWPVAFSSTKLIVHSHNGSDESKLWQHILAPIQNIIADYRWSCSDLASAWMFGKNFKTRYQNKHSVITVKNAVDLNRYQFHSGIRQRIRESLNVDQNTQVLGSVARLAEQKNHLRILSIFMLYHALNPNSVLILVGEGPKRQQIEDYIISHGLENSVKLLGNRSDVADLLQGFDLLLMPSLYEGLPFVAVESQASGLPVLISKSVDADVFITDRIRSMSLSDPDDAWVECLQKMITRADNKSRTTGIATAFKEKGFDLAHTILEIEKMYSEM